MNRLNMAQEIDDIGLSPRARNALVRPYYWYGGPDYTTIAAVAAATDSELLSVRTIGKGLLAEIRSIIPHKPRVEVTVKEKEYSSMDETKTPEQLYREQVAKHEADMQDWRTQYERETTILDRWEASLDRLDAWLEAQAEDAPTK